MMHSIDVIILSYHEVIPLDTTVASRWPWWVGESSMKSSIALYMQSVKGLGLEDIETNLPG